MSQSEDLPILITLFGGAAKAALYCAHRTSTASSCAFCEHEGHLATPSHLSEAARWRAQEIIGLHSPAIRQQEMTKLPIPS